jgi:NAD(P)H-dependent flavin oxidoreductase YrpB (nitropropane dioxygenase family)
VSLDKIVNKLKSECKIIQGGMGVGVSDYNLARTVSKLGQLGVVSGTLLDTVMIRRLQNGDENGDVRSALSEFPNQKIAEEIIERYYTSGGKGESENYKHSLFPRFKKMSDNSIMLANRNLENLLVAANFVEVNLAKRGHNNPVGINYLHKLQWTLMPSIFGAMLAGVDAVLMGAGLPKEIPNIIDLFSNGKGATMPINVVNNNIYSINFNPDQIIGNNEQLKKAAFLGIVSNHLGVRALPNVDGYIMEGYLAGGHNAPARSKEIDETGEPLYGIADDVNFKLLKGMLKKREKEQPYWMAGGYAKKLDEALLAGASGIQVGTLFAFCKESGVESNLKKEIIQYIMNGGEVYTDPVISPSGFPFKIMKILGTVHEKEIYDNRSRVCNIGGLVDLYENDGNILTRCPADKINIYVKSGGDINDTTGRSCLCNNLFSTIGLGSLNEPPIATAGSDFSDVINIVKTHGVNYTAKDVINYILKNT